MIGPPLGLRDRYSRAAAAGRPLIGGHRGDPARRPENTLSSFSSALDLGVDLIECDVHLSADGDLIVIHDHTLDRTTDGSGLVVAHRTSELRRLAAGEGERLPLFSEVCELVRGRAGLCVELKQLPVAYPELEERVVEALARHDLLDDCAVISFCHRSVARVRELEPRLQGGLLLVSRPIDPVRILEEAGAQIYSPHWSATDPELMNAIRASGGVVGTWTVDDPTAVGWSRHCPPDSLFTNHPEELMAEFAL